MTEHANRVRPEAPRRRGAEAPSRSFRPEARGPSRGSATRRASANPAWGSEDAACEAEARARWQERLVLELLRTLVAFTFQAAISAQMTRDALCSDAVCLLHF